MPLLLPRQTRMYKITEVLNERHTQFAGGFRNHFRFKLRRFIQSDWLASSRTPEHQAYLKRIAPESLTNDWIFKLFVQDYYNERIAAQLVETLTLTASDMSKIRILHDGKAKILARLNIKAGLAFLVAAAGVLLKTVPDSVIKWLDIERSDFEFWVFWMMGAYLLAIILFIAVPWLHHAWQQQRHQRVEDLLVYCEAVVDSRK